MGPSVNARKRVPSAKPLKSTVPETYNLEAEQANRNAYAGSQYATPNYNRKIESIYDYETGKKQNTEYYTPTLTPIDRAYQISRETNCMGGAPRLPGLLPCPYGTDAVACAFHAAGQEKFSRM